MLPAAPAALLSGDMLTTNGASPDVRDARDDAAALPALSGLCIASGDTNPGLVSLPKSPDATAATPAAACAAAATASALAATGSDSTAVLLAVSPSGLLLVVKVDRVATGVAPADTAARSAPLKLLLLAVKLVMPGVMLGVMLLLARWLCCRSDRNVNWRGSLR